MSCRKNQAHLTPAERTAFVNALLALKNSVPSQMGLASRYDDYVQIHMDSMMASPGWAHRAPAFFPWHRELLRRFELDLQAIDPTVSLPYWDWEVDNSPDPTVAGSPWTAEFMGGNGDPGQGDKVTTGPFRFDGGQWTLHVTTGAGGADRDNTNYLRRRLADPSGATSLPTPANVADALTVTPYDAAPWDTSAQPSFRNRLEGWYGAGSIHNRVHLWVGGNMRPMTSPNDPVFFLHHCNIDRLWTLWQRQHPGEPYAPGAGVAGAPAGHHLTDPMQPWGGATTPASVLDHHALGYWYDTDPPQVTLLTPSLAFTDIPEGIGGTGVTTYRAVVFEILSCDPVNLEITAGPTAPFGVPLGLAATVSPSPFAPPAHGRLWISYTSAPGSSVTGSVTVRVVETGQSWVVSLAANTVPRQKSAVVLVLDRSFSMTENAGDGQPKVEKLREAVGIFADAMLEGDGLGLVRFDDEVNRLSDVIDVGPTPAVAGSGRARAHEIIASHDPATTLDPRGDTSIGGGVQEGSMTLAAAPATVPPYSVRAMVVLTDGMENTPPMIADVAGLLTANTFAIGFGTPANLSVAALDALTQNHHGYLLVTGAITPDETFRLTKYFLQIQAGINNSSIVLDPQGELVLGAEHRIPFTVTEADMGLDVFLLCPVPGLVSFRLLTPAAEVLHPALSGVEPAIRFVAGSRASYYRLSLPALVAAPAGSHAGIWHALLSIDRAAADSRLDRKTAAGLRHPSLPYSLLVTSYSNLRFQVTVRQKSHVPGAEVVLRARLDEYDVPVEKRARVWAELAEPDGSRTVLPFAERQGGRFEAAFTASLPGVYVARVRASGNTFSGTPFHREQTVTAAVAERGDHQEPGRGPQASPSPGGEGDLLCRLLLCLLGERVLTPPLRKELAAKGLDLEALAHCVREVCKGQRSRPADNLDALHVHTALPTLATTPAWSAAASAPAFAELIEGQPVPRPEPAARSMDDGPMFDLSPEDKAAGGHDRGEETSTSQPASSAKAHHHAPHPPSSPVFDLSPEDKRAGGHDRGNEPPRSSNPSAPRVPDKRK